MDYAYLDETYGVVPEKKSSLGKIIPIAIAIILFIIVIAVLIISSRLLGQMNKSSCRDDEHVSNARRLSRWVVIISSIIAALLFLGFFAVIVFAIARATGKK